MRRCSIMAMALLMAAVCRAEDWPQYRGANGGVAGRDANPPINWSPTRNIRWKLEVPGRGRSSPIVVGNRIYVTTAMETNVVRCTIGSDDMQRANRIVAGLTCADRNTGKLLWHTALFDVDKPAPVHWYNSWATPTPAAADGRVYCDFGTFGTACVDGATGKAIWRQSLHVDHMVGPGSSVTLYKELVLLVRDGIDTQYVAALDRANGAIAWKTARPQLQGNREWFKAFTTPLVVPSGGRDLAVIPGAQWFVAYDAQTGQEVWRVRHGEGFSFGTVPVAGNGVVYCGSGLFNPQVWALKLDGQGDVTGTNVAWRCTRKGPDMSSPVLAGRELYWVTDNGIMCCADALTGEVVWQKPIPGTYLASPLVAAGRVYIFERDGKCTVMKTGREFALLAENNLPGPLAATPAMVGKSLYLRTDGALYCIQESGK